MFNDFDRQEGNGREMSSTMPLFFTNDFHRAEDKCVVYNITEQIIIVLWFSICGTNRPIKVVHLYYVERN